MALKLKDKKKIDAYLKKQVQLIDSAIIYYLQDLVLRMENHAKLSAGFQDQTSNLKSSEGGVVLKDGKAVNYYGFQNQGKADKGAEVGLEFINSLINEKHTGYITFIVAGMEYASYVENYYNLNVLKATELKMRQELPIILAKIKNKIQR